MEQERGFDFLEGEWDVSCRVPRNGGWVEAPGSLKVSRVLDGLVFLEFFEGVYHGGMMKALGLRAFNRETREWEHTWTDTLAPGHFHVWKGVFQDGKIDLCATWDDEHGRPLRSRLRMAGKTSQQQKAATRPSKPGRFDSHSSTVGFSFGIFLLLSIRGSGKPLSSSP